MEELRIKKILGGPANGLEVPVHWSSLATWHQEGNQSYVYQERSYEVGANRYVVWVPFNVLDSEIETVIRWHVEMHRETELEAQKILLREMMSAGAQYTQVIMVVAYAALIAFLTTFKATFTAGTALAAAIALGVSLLAFIGWELFGMVVRGRAGIRIAEAVENPWEHVERMRRYRQDAATFAVRFRIVWIAVMGLAVGAALTSFLIMGSAMLHGAWSEFASNGTCERTVDR